MAALLVGLCSLSPRLATSRRRPTAVTSGVLDETLQARAAAPGQLLPPTLMQHKLLNKDEERVVTENVRELRRWHAMRGQLKASLGQPPSDAQWASSLGFSDQLCGTAEFKQQLREKRRSRNRLIQSNMRLVVSVALKYKSYGVPLQDLVQEGTVGLIRATEKFEPDKGWRFNTYAHWWIRHAIGKGIEREGRMIRVPSYMLHRISTIGRARAVAYSATGQEPRVEEIHAELKQSGSALSERLVRRAMAADATTRTLASLSSPVGSSDDRPLHMILQDKMRPHPVQAAEDTATAQWLHALLESTLSSEERRVVGLKFGLAGNDAHKLPQLAARCGCSQAEVRADLNRALRKLRREGRSVGLAVMRAHC